MECKIANEQRYAHYASLLRFRNGLTFPFVNTKDTQNVSLRTNVARFCVQMLEKLGLYTESSKNENQESGKQNVKSYVLYVCLSVCLCFDLCVLYFVKSFCFFLGDKRIDFFW